MKALWVSLVLLLYTLDHSVALNSPPKVQVYSRLPGELGKANSLICHVSGFHPPEINIELLKNDQVIRTAHQTDLAFEADWHYYLTKSVRFTPSGGDKYACRVTHVGITKTFVWESDM